MSTNFKQHLGAGQLPFATAECVEAYAPIRPYPQQPQAIIYKERWAQLRAFYVRPAQNTPHPYLPQVYFADDQEMKDKQSGVVEWIRTYTTLPTSWNDFETFPYTFPGLQWSSLVLGRAPFSRFVTSKLVNDYFMVGTVRPNFVSGFTNYDDLNASEWVKSGVSTVYHASNIPECAGASNYATSLVASASNIKHQIYQSVTIASAGLAAASMFIRSNQAPVAPGVPCNYVRVFLNDNNVSAGSVDVNLITGQVSNINAVTASIHACGSGWWRVGVVGNVATNNAGILVGLLASENGPDVNNPGVQVIDAWRGQITTNAIPHSTVAPTTTPDATNYPILSADLIPQKFGTLFLYSPNAFPNSNIVVEYVSVLSSPNYETYWNANTSWVNTDQGNTNSYSIEANDSTQNLWHGGIWLRQRRYVKAR
jgi:hypothetical protein